MVDYKHAMLYKPEVPDWLSDVPEPHMPDSVPTHPMPREEEDPWPIHVFTNL